MRNQNQEGVIKQPLKHPFEQVRANIHESKSNTTNCFESLKMRESLNK